MGAWRWARFVAIASFITLAVLVAIVVISAGISEELHNTLDVTQSAPGGTPTPTANKRDAVSAEPRRDATTASSGDPAAVPGDASAASPNDDGETADDAAEPQEFTVLMSGDVLLHENAWAQAKRDGDGRGYDFKPMLSHVRPTIYDADLAICHLETPVGTVDGPFSGYPIFSVPPQIVPALAWAGYDACTTASNHTIDKADAGVKRTLDAMDKADIAHAGSARTRIEAQRITIVEVGDRAAESVRVALLSYTYGLNGLRPPEGKEWIVNLIDEERILSDAARARRRGAEVVLVALHWGLEYEHRPTSDQRELAGRLLRSPDIDLVYGHHAHVVQPFQRINGKWVAYGLGNHLAKQSRQRPRTHEGVMAQFTFIEVRPGRWAVTTAEYLPTRVPLQPPIRLLDLTAERTSQADEQVYERVRDTVESLGADSYGLRPGG